MNSRGDRRGWQAAQLRGLRQTKLGAGKNVAAPHESQISLSQLIEEFITGLESGRDSCHSVGNASAGPSPRRSRIATRGHRTDHAHRNSAAPTTPIMSQKMLSTPLKLSPEALANRADPDGTPGGRKATARRRIRSLASPCTDASRARAGTRSTHSVTTSQNLVNSPGPAGQHQHDSWMETDIATLLGVADKITQPEPMEQDIAEMLGVAEKVTEFDLGLGAAIGDPMEIDHLDW
jgi:hypothetical protein